jgi:hypothetical protein
MVSKRNIIEMINFQIAIKISIRKIVDFSLPYFRAFLKTILGSKLTF